MTSYLKTGLVQIQKAKGDIVGAGFLTGERYVITCAHVIRDALNLEKTPPSMPQKEIHLRFPFVALDKPFRAKVIHWIPRRSDAPGDIAVLEIIGYPHPKCRPLSLATKSIDKLQNRAFSVFGFPYKSGSWAEGIVKDERPDGSVQLEDIKVTGKPIEGGFSGSPVWDKELRQVIGIVSTADGKFEKTKVSFMTPIQLVLKLCPQIIQESKPVEQIEVPVAVIAMTREEANFFVENRDLSDELGFHQFRQIFTDEDIDEWLAHYKDDRNDWQPHLFTDTDVSIQDIIHYIVDEYNFQSSQQKIVPNFVSQQFFDPHSQTDTWHDIREGGGIIIVDAISLFHPSVQDIFKTSGVDSHKKVAILGLTPLSKRAIQAHQLIEAGTDFWIPNTFRRFSSDLDEICELGVNNQRLIERWLFKTLPKTAKSAHEHKMNPHNQQQFRRQFGYERGRRGMGKVVGQGVVRQ